MIEKGQTAEITSFRLTPAMSGMLKVVSLYEDRNTSAIIRRAIDQYFKDQGYYEKDFLLKLEQKGTTK